ncbi:hypothetical protein ACEQ8H_008591 [Pleosporales sp. CAS-2024a]
MADTEPSTNGRSLLLAKISTTVSYLLFLVTAVYYAFHSADAHNGSFWAHNYSSPFAQSSIFTSLYWLALFVLQAGYLYAFYTAHVSSATLLTPYWVASQLLLFGFVHLFARGHFVIAELLLIINFANLTLLYFRHSTTPRYMHIGVVSGPLAWNFVALYWCGALAVTSNGFVARIIANVFIWGWAGYGAFFLVAYKDYTMGYALSILSFSTGVGQFLTRPHLFQLQWIFAFTIGGLLFLLSTAVGLPGLLGKEPFPRGAIVSEDRERAPLLADE